MQMAEDNGIQFLNIAYSRVLDIKLQCTKEIHWSNAIRTQQL